MMTSDPCPFCQPASTLILRESEHARALQDAFPVAPGHTLVVPRRHVASFFDLDPLEQADLLNLLIAVRNALAEQHRPDAFNLGLNDGEAAGQTILHCHWHVIPRHTGDVADPRGGVRWVVPERAVYWADRRDGVQEA
jgi:diadenosine tetraphosphate (Ap4A) HIT family hydrolase